MNNDKANLEHDLFKCEYIVNKCKNSDVYAQNLYATLCNQRFLKGDEEWTCSWRMSGGIVADLRNKGEDYIDFYCSGIGLRNDKYISEGTSTEEIRNDLLDLGWRIEQYPDAKDWKLD